MREAQVNLAIRWFIGYGLHEDLPDHSELTRIRQRWGAERFRRIFERTVEACVEAKIAKGEIVHIDASLIRADVSWESLAVRHVDDVLDENDDEAETSGEDRPQDRQVQEGLRHRSGRDDGDQRAQPAARAGLQAARGRRRQPRRDPRRRGHDRRGQRGRDHRAASTRRGRPPACRPDGDGGCRLCLRQGLRRARAARDRRR